MMTKSIQKTLIVVLVSTLAVVCSAHAGMTKKTVEAEGRGSSFNLAIYDALDEAIGRINGRSLETKQQIETIKKSTTHNHNSDYFLSKDFQKSVNTATKGIVDSYDVISKKQRDDGLYSVTLSVTVVKYVSKNNNRKRIAVFPMRIGQGRFLIDGAPVNRDRIQRIMTQSLVSTLVQSRKFNVLDREYIAETVGEQSLALSSNVPVEEAARLGQELVADYIMVGTIEDLGYTEQKIKMQSSGRELTSRQGYVEFALRLVDVATRQIVYSDFVRLRVTGFDSIALSEGVDASIALIAANQVGRKIIDTIYPLVIVSVRGKSLTLGQGGSQIKEGDQFEIFKYGNRLTDPYTKEFLGREEIKVGSLEITRVNPKQSYAKLLESSLDIEKEFEPKKFICRVILDAPDKKKLQREERRKKRDVTRKKRDDSW